MQLWISSFRIINTLLVYSCKGIIFLAVLLDQNNLLLHHPFEGIYSVAVPICYGWTWNFWIGIDVCHHRRMFSNLVSPWVSLLMGPVVFMLRVFFKVLSYPKLVLFLLHMICYMSVMAQEEVTKRTEHHSYSIGIYLQEQRMVTRT